MPSAGRFRYIIDVLKDRSTDTDPDPDFTGPEYLKDWRADFIEPGGVATFRGNQVSEQVKAIFEIREDPLKFVDAKMRVRHDGREYHIESVKREHHGGEHPRTFLFCTDEV